MGDAAAHVVVEEAEDDFLQCAAGAADPSEDVDYGTHALAAAIVGAGALTDDDLGAQPARGTRCRRGDDLAAGRSEGESEHAVARDEADVAEGIGAAEASRPNQRWVADFTSVADPGFVKFMPVPDCPAEPLSCGRPDEQAVRGSTPRGQTGLFDSPPEVEHLRRIARAPDVPATGVLMGEHQLRVVVA
ncbi:hypothetical protein [Streptomyces sp. HUAS ZL42]|uniref:hypothetical protein n=1 Tax=Streptomyces sp. HUAS ZL42 TaxID=3231715 RepID=UPI00345EA67B